MIVGATEAASLPQPHPDAVSMQYWRQTGAERQLVRRCETCGKETVYAFTVKHRAPVIEFAAITPYVIAPIELAHGLRMMANSVGSDDHEVRVGDTIRVCFERRGNYKLPQFRRSRDE